MNETPRLRRAWLLTALLLGCGGSQAEPEPLHGEHPSADPAAEDTSAADSSSGADSEPADGATAPAEPAGPVPSERDDCDEVEAQCGLACPNGTLVQPPCEPCRCEEGAGAVGMTPLDGAARPAVVEGTVEPSDEPLPAGCHVELRAQVRPLDDGRFAVRAVARNRTDRTLVFHFRPRCPGGDITFQGLRPGYDFYGTCAMGACMPQAPREVRLSPGASTGLAMATIDPRRSSPCNGERIAPGRYPIEPVVPAEIDVTACTRSATLSLAR
jgi:hypothetical protein